MSCVLNVIILGFTMNLFFSFTKQYRVGSFELLKK